MFLPQEVIRKKRDGLSLSTEEIQAFVQGVTQTLVSDAQIAAFTMAIYLQEMDANERIALTCAMRDSGQVLQWDALNLAGPILDKHSTGGVGDLVSLVLGPLLAACGAFVPMISGRGLGHTGGTLDKLSAIEGYTLFPDLETFAKVTQQAGVAIVGQTSALAPADKRFYAVRDVTATVENLSLITASILSKKLAAGLQGLVMDIKVGNGAFMRDQATATALAEVIVAVAEGAGMPTRALLTDMNQPLACAAGNALELRESLRFLTGEKRSERLQEVTLALGVELLQLGHLADDEEEARRMLLHALDSGKALEHFARMVSALGGPTDFVEKLEQYLHPAPWIQPVMPDTAGWVSAIDTRALGLVVVSLGGGRVKETDQVDVRVGLDQCVQLGDWVDPQQPLAFIHAKDQTSGLEAAQRVQKALVIGERPVQATPLWTKIAPKTL